MKNVLFASSEAVPFIKTGGLADVVGSLPRYFDKNEYDVRIIIPKYACMADEFCKGLELVCHFYVNLNWRKQYVGIFKTEYQGITYYMVDNEFYFGGPGPYDKIYEDVEKFAYFSKAVLAALPYMEFVPDIIQCNDWQTGLIPVFLKTMYGSDEFYRNIKTVFAIHNMKFQGRWKINEVVDITGLPYHIFNSNELESYGEANYLKGGIVYADAVSTVSPSYAHDITTPEGGEGLHGLMEARKDVLHGILNGLDYAEYNPADDKYIKFHFDKNDISNKRKNKEYLQKATGLTVDDNALLIGIVSRMTDQKGFDLVAYVIDEILETMDVQFAVLGTGENRYESMFHHIQSKYPDRVTAHIGYSEERAHQIYASCDAFLMPSLFEPCGLSQLMSMRYGTLPVVRETGGLKDTVTPYNEYQNTGNGFSFTKYNAHDMLHVIQYAYSVFRDNRQAWNDMVVRAMSMDYSWNASARQYEEMYQNLDRKVI